MKLIPSSRINGSISAAVTKFRSNGILACSTDDYANIPRYSSTARGIKQGVWIHLNHQYQDAINLLNNSDHFVMTALTKEQMTEIETSSKKSLYDLSEKLFSNLAKSVLYLFVIGFSVFALFTVINS